MTFLLKKAIKNMSYVHNNGAKVKINSLSSLILFSSPLSLWIVQIILTIHADARIELHSLCYPAVTLIGS